MSTRRTAYEKAQELAAAQKNEAALIAFEQAMKEEPDDFKAVMGAGLMLQRLGQHDEAVTVFSRSLALQPRIAEIHYSRALSLQDLGRRAAALVDLENALALRSDYVDARYALGVNLKALERFDEASRAFTEVLAQAGVYPAASHVRWSPKVGQDGSLNQNQNHDPHVQEASSA